MTNILFSFLWESFISYISSFLYIYDMNVDNGLFLKKGRLLSRRNHMTYFHKNVILKSSTLYNKYTLIKVRKIVTSKMVFLCYLLLLSPHGNLDLELYEDNVAILDRWIIRHFYYLIKDSTIAVYYIILVNFFYLEGHFYYL